MLRDRFACVPWFDRLTMSGERRVLKGMQSPARAFHRGSSGVSSPPWALSRVLFAALFGTLLALAAGGPSPALAAPGDGTCTATPAAVSNLTPTLVILRSGADDGADPISAHVGLDHTLVIRDPGGDGTARPNQRALSAAEQTVLGENIGFQLPTTNMAGEFEVLTIVGDATSDCIGGAAGVYDGLAIGQAEALLLPAEPLASLKITVRGTSKGLPLRASTMVTLSTSRGEFVAVNGEAVAPTRVVQLTLTAGPPVEGAAEGTVLWAPTPGERAGSATMTATAQQDGTSLFKTVSGSIAARPLTTEAGFLGILPGSGQTALLVTTREFATVDLAAALEAAGCKPASVAVLEGGAWEVFVPGAPDVINAAFPTSLPAEKPFVARCA